MWGIIPAIVSIAQMYAQHKANQRQQAFAANQSATQYQRAVKDMQAAGLNPMLAYQQGGNSNMSISPQSVMGDTFSNVASAIAMRNETKLNNEAVANAKKQGQILDEGVNQAHTKSRSDLWDWNAKTALWDNTVKRAETALDQARSDVENTNADTAYRRSQKRISDAEATDAEWEAGKTRMMNKFGDTFPGGGVLKYLPGVVGGIVGSGAKTFADTYGGGFALNMARRARMRSL